MGGVIAFALANWRWLLPLVACLGLAIDDGIRRLEVAHLEARIASEAAARAEAVRKAQDKADALANELVIQQAIAMGATAKKADTNVQQIHAASSDADRMRAGSRGVRDLIRPGGAETQRGAPVALH